jgi:hypothetical protein
MSLKPTIPLLFIFSAFFMQSADAQKVKKYDLVKLLKANKLDTAAVPQTHILDDAQKHAISTIGTVWLKDVNFKEGTIDIDLRGKDEFLKSFLGIAFHAKDTATYDVVYFRPFRFRSTDPPTRKWSVQYMSMPNFDYDKLRKAQPGIYENDIIQAPRATDWFHATIVIKDDWITVYVNRSATPSLKVKKLNDNTDGKIGLWSSKGALSGDFANLSIRSSK